ncbi:MAG: hypothetical protein V4649_03930 [Bacteroidota bacterium]
MKKLVLICCIAAASTMAFGQGTRITKSGFNAKAGQLNLLLEQSRADEAKATWDEVHKMMMSEMTGVKYAMREAITASNTAEVTRLKSVIQTQFAAYSSIIKVRSNMVQNKALIKAKLNEFGTRIL